MSAIWPMILFLENLQFMNDQPQQNNKQYNNPPIRRVPIKDPQIQPLGGGTGPESRLPIKPIIMRSETKPPMSKRIAGNLGPVLIIIVVVFGLTYIWLNFSGYFDPLNMCRIRIHADLVTGNKKSITQALSLLKKEDRGSYNIACQYVDRIYERTCFGADWHIDRSQRGSKEPGCYVKGSKSIYIKPDFKQDSDSANTRKESIKKYSQLAREYWLSK